MSRSRTAVGAREPLIDADSFVRGLARYSTDLELPGMLHCALRYSDEPHARVVRVDDAAARRLPGVIDVITAANVPAAFVSRFGMSVSDRQLLVTDKVRSVADVVAAVAAEDLATAQAAARLIDVEYSRLPAAFTTDEALAPGAPLIHDAKTEFATAEYITDHHVTDANNVSTDMLLRKGDVQAARDRSVQVARRTYSTQRIEHVHMEPHATLASYDRGTSRLTLWTSIGKPFRVLSHLGAVLGLPLSRINLITPAVGGDFGGKGEMALEPYCGLLSMRTGRPVKSVFSREDEFVASTCKVPFEIELEIGVDADGHIEFLWADLRLDAGAYNGLSSMVGIHALTHLEGPYAIANLAVRTRTIYTNNIVSGAFRGFGAPQVSFARESLLDELACRVSCDPIEFRLRSAWRAGVTNCTGQTLDAEHHSVTIRETLQAARPALERARAWRDADAPAGHCRGVGVASAHQALGGGVWTGADTATAIVKLNLDGSVTVTIGVADVGQGTSTALRQIVAEELRLPVGAVALTLRKETDVVPFHGGASASRQLFTSGNAVRLAGESMHRELLHIAGELLEADPDDLELEAGGVRVSGTAVTRTFEQLAMFSTHKLGEQPIVREAFRAPVRMLDAQLQGAPFQSFDYVTQVAEVDVDLDTGEVRLCRLVTVEDVGRAINPMIVEGQIDGCVAQGVGYALFEQIQVEHGRVLNPFLFDYRIPRMEDLPRFESVILEQPDPRGPHGAKAAGEAAIVPAAAAIANAVHDALGVRMRRLPLTSERVWSAMRDGVAADLESSHPAFTVPAA